MSTPHSPLFYLDLPTSPWSLEEIRVAAERHQGRKLILEPAPSPKRSAYMDRDGHG